MDNVEPAKQGIPDTRNLSIKTLFLIIGHYIGINLKDFTEEIRFASIKNAISARTKA